MTGLFHAHSGLRYLVLLVGLVHVVVAALALAKKQPPGKASRVLSSAFMGLVHAQLLVGLGLVLMGRWYGALVGHLVMMVLAAVSASFFPALNKRRAQPSAGLALAGTLLALLLIAGGIFAIGRHPFQATAFVAPAP